MLSIHSLIKIICLWTPNFYYAKHWSSWLKNGYLSFLYESCAHVVYYSHSHILWYSDQIYYCENLLYIFHIVSIKVTSIELESCLLPKKVTNSKWSDMIKNNVFFSHYLQEYTKIKLFVSLFSNNRSTFFLEIEKILIPAT